MKSRILKKKLKTINCIFIGSGWSRIEKSDQIEFKYMIVKKYTGSGVGMSYRCFPEYVYTNNFKEALALEKQFKKEKG